LKRGYLTAKASRPDVYRAANELLRMALDGRLCLSLKPKGYNKNKEHWMDDTETKELNEIVQNVEAMAKRNSEKRKTQNLNDNYYDDEEEEESDQNYYRDPLGSSDEKEKKDDSSSSDQDESDELASHKNPFSVLSHQE
jgi:hypothetical protein